MCLIKCIKNLFIVWGVDFKVGNFASQSYYKKVKCGKI